MKNKLFHYDNEKTDKFSDDLGPIELSIAGKLQKEFPYGLIHIHNMSPKLKGE